MTEPDKIANEAAVPARRRIVDFALTRLRGSRILQACAILSFLDYGALIMLAVKHGPDGKSMLTGFMAMFIALMSVASWYFMFGWYPFLESLLDSRDGRMKAVGRVLESLAIGCVTVVHAMLTMVLVGVVTNHLKFA